MLQGSSAAKRSARDGSAEIRAARPKEDLVMNRFVLLAAAILLLIPCVADANCGDGLCDVGATGTGGVNSGGSAQGYYYTKPTSLYPGQQISNSGNLSSGRINVTGGFVNLSGHFNDKQGAVFGHAGGGEFGEWSGQCAYEDFDAGECE
jgi:hypothetical protein